MDEENGSDLSATEARSAALDYIGNIQRLLLDITTQEMDKIETSAQLITKSLSSDGLVHIFGSGHSHLLALELFYRAGGMLSVFPILDERLMLHDSAASSTVYERSDEVLAEISAEIDFSSHDVLIVISNSGGNRVAIGVAEKAISDGIPVIVLTSMKHAGSPLARSRGRKLHEVADVVLDNMGVLGDASVRIAGTDITVGPTSTVLGATILNAVMARVAQLMSESSQRFDYFKSSNVAGGDEENAKLIEKYSSRVKGLV